MIFTPDHQSGWSLRPQRPSAPPLRGFFRRLVSSSRAPSPSLPSHPCRKLFHSAARPLPVKARFAGNPVRLNPLRFSAFSRFDLRSLFRSASPALRHSSSPAGRHVRRLCDCQPRSAAAFAFGSLRPRGLHLHRFRHIRAESSSIPPLVLFPSNLA